MSYSRWSTSVWYTFWQYCGEAVPDTRDSAVFAICGEGGFTAKELRDSLDACMAKVNADGSYSEAEMAELRGYVAKFLADVDREYPNVQ